MVDAFSPIKVRTLTMPNRFMRSATHETAADDSGMVTEKGLAIYESLGKGEIGLITTGYAFVSADGQALPGQYGAHADAMLPALSRLAETVHRSGGRIALQIVHAGAESPFLRQRNLPLLAPSAIDGQSLVREMNQDDIHRVILAFGDAAARAREAGFDAVQLHGAHGYLVSQFLSPLTNRRRDDWGGSAENRRRFPVEVVREVRRRLGNDFPVLIKLGVMDDQSGGATLAEGVEAARAMIEAGLDGIEVSHGIGGGELVAGKDMQGPPPFRERASVLKRQVSVPIMLVGRVRSLEIAQSVLDSGDADVLSMSRPFIREPGLVKRWRGGDRRPADCISCSRCFRMLAKERGPLESYCWQEQKQAQ